jgi:glycerophosphoryl diester phosphodiesterase
MLFSSPTLIGHRGLCAFAPENTLESFEMAYRKGLKWVEFDVQLTSDDKLVVIHDETLDRTTPYQGRVRDHTAQTITPLVPTLESILRFLNQHHMHANIEIKGAPEDALLITECLLKALPSLVQPDLMPLISSFNPDILTLLAQKAPQYPRGYLMETVDFVRIKTLNTSDNITLNCSINTPLTTLKHLAQLGFCLLIYTVNDKKTAETLFQHGVMGVFTDGNIC